MVAIYVVVAIGLYVLENAWLAVAMYQAVMAAAMLATNTRSRRALFKGLGLSWALGVAGLLILAGAGLYYVWPVLLHSDAAETLARLRVPHSVYPLFAVYFVAITPALEEVFWRDLTASRSTRPAWRDAVFAGYHVLVLRLFLPAGLVVVCFCILLAAGWLWRRFTMRYGGLAFAVFTHVVADAVLLISVFASLTKTT